MSKRVVIGIVMLLVLSISSVVYASNAIILVNDLNVRSGPGLDYDVITQVNQDEQYEILSEQGEWIEIQLTEGTVGWVTRDYISVNEDSSPTPAETENTQTEEEEAKEAKHYVITHYNKTILRTGPSVDFDILDSVEKGQSLEVLGEENDWYEVSLKDQVGYVEKWLVNPQSSVPISNQWANKTIVIDPGHGGRDVGAIGQSGSYEKTHTVRTALKLKEELELLGAHVILTRTVDQYMSLSGRASVANLYHADAFISLHYNSTPEIPSASGISSYYYHERNESLAIEIQNELMKATGMDDRGTQFGDFQVIRENHRPSVLLELGFLSNVEEEEKIMSVTFQEKLSEGIIKGLTNYFRIN
ncbi:N-acetylmuramoyl-L-alanine amidase [Radiobacillus kanasensis]|uniref:N-acetylmuramoyl-L-alanine amidase n=1 Tax=Radiobacillus kanasensis TaxID=2844358 RepID=UPI001E63B0DD|nr:N-acetylmuramoyl-L-alanine amidase [Radiobacillus kanasensis]UFT97882.1 N-acetylmuramoyl-L-alanine amidase [Radiobacillus kanasensis]